MGRYEAVCHTVTFLVGLKPHRHFSPEKYHTGMSQGQYRSQRLLNYLNSSAITLSREALLSTQNAPETICRPGSARTRCGSSLRSPKPSSWIWGRELRTGKGQKQKEGKWRKVRRRRKEGKERDKVSYGHFFLPTSIPAFVLH